MTFYYLLLALAAVLAVLTIRTVVHDYRGTARPPRSHLDDPQFRSPAPG